MTNAQVYKIMVAAVRGESVAVLCPTWEVACHDFDICASTLNRLCHDLGITHPAFDFVVCPGKRVVRFEPRGEVRFVTRQEHMDGVMPENTFYD